MKKNNPVVKIVILVLIMAMLLIAIVQNLSLSSVKFLVLDLSVPVIAVILVSFFGGFITGTIVVLLMKREKQNPGQKAEKQIDEKDNKIAENKKK